MNATMSDLKVYESLSVIHFEGFKADAADLDGSTDPVGSANWLCERYGQTEDPSGFDATGILWTDYQVGGDWDFSALVATDEAEALAEFARGSGYTVDRTDTITEPTNYGDGHDGTVEILKHRDGWVILPN